MVFRLQLKLINGFNYAAISVFNLRWTSLMDSSQRILRSYYLLPEPCVISYVTNTIDSLYYLNFQLLLPAYAGKNFTKHNTFQNYPHYCVNGGKTIKINIAWSRGMRLKRPFLKKRKCYGYRGSY